MGLFSWRSCVSGHDIMNEWNEDGLYDGMAILLPDNTIISGECDGYGGITTKEGNYHDVYGLMAKIMFGEENRDLIFNGPRRFFNGDDKWCFTLDIFSWDQKIEIKDIVSGADGFNLGILIGKTMNELTKDGYKEHHYCDDADKMIKVMHRSEVKKGMKYDDYEASESAEGQGHWYSEYETRVKLHDDEDDEW